MAKPTGFMEYQRQDIAKRDILERIGDWQEVHGAMFAPTQLKEQAARCMDCSLPFCHTGEMSEGKLIGCPLHNLMPEINNFAYNELTAYAYRRLRKQNNFPEFTGRVCPAPCESACSVGLHGEPVSIRNIELNLVEKAFADNIVQPRPPQKRSGKKVAIVGSGPAGLAVADTLNKLGHAVCVYERADRPGGLLMYGIPNMKLDKQIILRRVNILAQEGVEFIYNTQIGKHISADTLLRSFDAVVLCPGSTVPRDLDLPGRKLAGIIFAKEYLQAATVSLLNTTDTPAKLNAHGKNVVIIGGGDTGTDCVATAIRQGCKSVKQLEIMPCLPGARPLNTPWPLFPQTHKIDYGQAEALELYHSDPREYCVLTKEFIGQNTVCGLKTVKVNLCDGKLVPVADTQQIHPAEMVILAMGFVGTEQNLLDAFGVSRTAKGTIAVHNDTCTTDLAKVFAAGDARRGQSLVVWAIAEGRKAAYECHEFLSK